MVLYGTSCNRVRLSFAFHILHIICVWLREDICGCVIDIVWEPPAPAAALRDAVIVDNHQTYIPHIHIADLTFRPSLGRLHCSPPASWATRALLLCAKPSAKASGLSFCTTTYHPSLCATLPRPDCCPFCLLRRTPLVTLFTHCLATVCSTAVARYFRRMLEVALCS